MTNFDFLLKDKQFETFSGVAVAAEKTLHIDLSTCIINCRRAMEFAVKWMYSVDGSLLMPYQDTLVSLMNTEEFRDIVGGDIWRRMDFIRRMGNNAAHTGKKITEEQAALCLENLYIFMDFIACCYAKEYEQREFDHSLTEKLKDAVIVEKPLVEGLDLQLFAEKEKSLEQLMAENEALKAELTARREEQ